MALLHKIFPQLRKLRTYRNWVRRYDTLRPADRKAIAAAITRIADPPLVSVVMPVYETPERHLGATIESVCRQLYPHWELCIADDASPSPQVRTVIETHRARDTRIRVDYRNTRGGVSAASNSACALARGQFVTFLDPEDILPEHALYVVAASVADNPEVDLIFTDEDKITPDGIRFDPWFKSDWNPELMLSQNAFSHLGVYRRSLLDKIGGFDSDFSAGAHYDLVLRASTRTPPQRIRHIPMILYHRRAEPELIPGAAVAEDTNRAVGNHLAQSGIQAAVTASPWPSLHRIRYFLPRPVPGVSIIIPTRDRLDLMRRCMNGLLQNTEYENFEIIIVDNGSVAPETHDYFAALSANMRVRILPYPGRFNYSIINNLAARQARHGILALLNNDIEVKQPAWLREMVSYAVRPEIGAVGAKLYYPDNKIQHGGVIVGLGAGAGHAFRNFDRDDSGYHQRLRLAQDFSAVTSAAIVLRREVFDAVGGFDENLPLWFNDLDFCLRIRQQGYRIVWTPYAELYHWESRSVGAERSAENAALFQKMAAYIAERWGGVLEEDPFYNPNLARDREDFSLAFPPRIVPPWRRQSGREFRSTLV
ncbi:MAG: glycosyltransferase [Alphaproteobacteria bacterium]